MKDLLKEIASIQHDNEVDLDLVQNAEELIERLSSEFKFNFGHRYWWESSEGTQYDYQGDSWLRKLEEFLSPLAGRVYMVVTDDEYGPWPIYSLSKGNLILLLPELRHFEYFVFDDNMQRVVFDTHLNAFVVRDK